jgi:hypothetical protein
VPPGVTQVPEIQSANVARTRLPAANAHRVSNARRTARAVRAMAPNHAPWQRLGLTTKARRRARSGFV